MPNRIGEIVTSLVGLYRILATDASGAITSAVITLPCTPSRAQLQCRKHTHCERSRQPFQLHLGLLSDDGAQFLCLQIIFANSATSLLHFSNHILEELPQACRSRSLGVWAPDRASLATTSFSTACNFVFEHRATHYHLSLHRAGANGHLSTRPCRNDQSGSLGKLAPSLEQRSAACRTYSRLFETPLESILPAITTTTSCYPRLDW